MSHMGPLSLLMEACHMPTWPEMMYCMRIMLIPARTSRSSRRFDTKSYRWYPHYSPKALGTKDIGTPQHLIGKDTMSHQQESGLWGELQDSRGLEEWGLSSSDMEDLLTPQPPPPAAPILYQPSQEETPSFQILPPEFCRTDALVLNTIRLLQYQRQMAQLIARAQNVGVDPSSLPSCPGPPDDPPNQPKAAKLHYLNFLPPTKTAFMCGKSQPQRPEVEGTTARLILRKAVAAVCAHAGYTDTTESVLKVLTDLTHEFLQKLTGMLRANTDTLQLTDNCPFQDVVEQTLHNMGLGSMRDLHAMYRDRVVGYHNRVKQEGLIMYQQYLSLTQAKESNVPTPGRSRRESSGDWWGEEGSNQLNTGVVGVMGMPGIEEASVSSIKSSSSLDPELSLHPFSVLSHLACSLALGGWRW
ncbi:spt7 isoform X2 [Oratosquilla oratoria]|uniref:spt7 isoform X2 n=1 Tax=Oratosquilla oratoria TaxID=337810 RepID=UPI003F76FAC8